MVYDFILQLAHNQRVRYYDHLLNISELRQDIFVVIKSPFNHVVDILNSAQLFSRVTWFGLYY